ncbi:MAG: 23S rRNA (pseudouridine(1915)-N(3))-methyltransferase RlmH [Gammaproteobacteria bacterium]
MRIDVFGVCRRPPLWVRDATQAYTRRMPRDVPVAFSHIAPGPNSVSSDERRRDEAQRLLKRIKPTTRLIALDERGVEADSAAVAHWLEEWRSGGADVALVIGGADGHGEVIFDQAQQRWSLSRLTLPHLLVQLVVAEQLYRAWSIIDGHPYHRG